MAQQQETQGNELSFELLKNTQQIAEQAAIRAKEIAIRSKVPDIPSRGGGGEKAPEIPPKRLNLKKTVMDDNFSNGNTTSATAIPIPQRNQERKPPPPVPQKPSSAQNSPRFMDKMIHPVVPAGLNPISMATMPSSSLPQQQMFHERVSQNSPQLSAKNQNIVNILNSPLFQQRANQYKIQQQHPMMTRQNQMKLTDDDFGSEDAPRDALRGIERGLMNMERAMKEQMTMRNMDFVDGGGGKGNEVKFNPMEFKRSLGGSFNSLDGGNGQTTTAINTMRMMGGGGNMRLNFDGQAWGQRAIERNFSMDQMSIALQNAGMKGVVPMDVTTSQPPKHNIYRSLDRTLPLELQFSRHRQQQELEFMRQNNQILNLRQQQQQQQQQSREDLNLRRRSSHDETQYIMHQQKPATVATSIASGNAVDNSGGMLMTLS